METMQSVLDIPFDKEFQEELIPDGEEVRVKVAVAENHVNDRGNETFHIILTPLGFPTAAPVHKYFGKPVKPENIERSAFSSDDEYNEALRQNNNKIRALRRFFEAIGMELKPVDLSDPRKNDLVGRECRTIMSIEQSQDPQYEPKNIVKSFG